MGHVWITDPGSLLESTEGHEAEKEVSAADNYLLFVESQYQEAQTMKIGTTEHRNGLLGLGSPWTFPDAPRRRWVLLGFEAVKGFANNGLDGGHFIVG